MVKSLLHFTKELAPHTMLQQGVCTSHNVTAVHAQQQHSCQQRSCACRDRKDTVTQHRRAKQWSCGQVSAAFRQPQLTTPIKNVLHAGIGRMQQIGAKQLSCTKWCSASCSRSMALTMTKTPWCYGCCLIHWSPCNNMVRISAN